MSKARGSLLLIAARLANFGLLIVAVPLYLALLGEVGYGVCLFMSSVLVYVNLLDLGFSAGSHKLIIEAFDRKDDDRAWTLQYVQFTLATLVAVAGFAVLVVVGQVWVIDPSLSGPTRNLFFAAAGLTFATTVLNQSLVPALVGRGLFGRMALLNVSTVAFGTGLSLLFSWLWKTPAAWFGGQALGGILAFGASLAFAFAASKETLARFRFRADVVRELFKFGLRTYVHRLWGSLAGTADRLQLGAGNPERLVAYSVPARIPECLQMLVRPVVETLLPDLTRSLARGAEEFAGRVHGYSIFVLLLATSAVLVPSGFAVSIVRVWLGEGAFLGAEWVVIPLAVYVSLEAYFASLSAALYATGNPQRLIWFAAFNGVATLALTMPMYRWHGVGGVALMNMGIGLAQFATLPAAIRRMGVSALDLRSQMWRSLLVLSFGGALALAAHALSRSTLFVASPWLCFPGMALLAVLQFVACVRLGICPLPDGVGALLASRRFLAWMAPPYSEDRQAAST